MSSSHSISVWIARLRASDPEAARALWERFFSRIVRLARQRLRGVPRRAADEEDVALSAFASLLRGVKEGRFPRLNDRDDLWNVLFTLTVRKAVTLVRRESRLKRGGPQGDVHALALDDLVSRDPTPAQVAALRDELERLLGMLDDDRRGGLQAFAVVASREPLPAFAVWQAKRGAGGWRRWPAADKVWSSDGEGVYPALPGAGIDRGHVGQLPGAPPLAELAHSLLGGRSGTVVEVLAFGVRPEGSER